MNRRMKRGSDGVVILLLIVLLMLGVNVSGLKVNAETWGDYEYEVLEDGTVSITGYTEKDSVLEIPDTIDNKKVTSIEKRAFYWCDGITSIVIPESVMSIGDWAFLRCSGLMSVTIPESVTSIGDGAFAQCGGLTSISVGANNQNYCSEDGVLLKKDKSELLCHPAGKTGIYNSQ